MIYQFNENFSKISINSQTIIQFDDNFFSFFVGDRIKKVYLNGDSLLFSIDKENKIYNPLYLLKNRNNLFDEFEQFINNILKQKIQFETYSLNFEKIKQLWKFIDIYEIIQKNINNIIFFDTFKDQLDWNNIYHRLNEKIIEKFKDKVNWYRISKYENLALNFIEKYQDKVNWTLISNFQKLPEDFIEKHQDRVDWISISYHQTLSECFIEKFQNKVDWGCISQKQKLSENFIKKFNNKIDWELIFKYQKLDNLSG